MGAFSVPLFRRLKLRAAGTSFFARGIFFYHILVYDVIKKDECEMKNEPEYLYHYTSLESLALILKNKTIRLNPLDKMDDIDESCLGNYSNAEKYVFVSSWTEDKRESIPFWSMYTSNMSGVRIKLHIRPFRKYSYVSTPNLTVTPVTQFYIPQNQITGNDYLITPTEGVFVTKVKYTSNQEELYPKIGIKTDSSMRLDMNEVGKYKRSEWDFQKEWRYRMLCFPMSMESLNTKLGAAICMQRIESGYDMQKKYIDLDIEESYFKDIEIMRGPKMSEGEKVLLDILVKTYCPTAKIINSELKIR